MIGDIEAAQMTSDKVHDVVHQNLRTQVERPFGVPRDYLRVVAHCCRGIVHVAKFEYGAAQIEFENAADSSTAFAPASLNKSVN